MKFDWLMKQEVRIKELIKLLRNCSEVFLQVRKLIGQHFSERFYWHGCKYLPEPGPTGTGEKFWLEPQQI